MPPKSGAVRVLFEANVARGSVSTMVRSSSSMTCSNQVPAVGSIRSVKRFSLAASLLWASISELGMVTSQRRLCSHPTKPQATVP
mmetsp:Transcript_36411/g.95801  ORF Transcript_36411/g.95801 Transcript_36411/m.95801 type:complete len:85 (-) Transcript_36411:922-1176(-)